MSSWCSGGWIIFIIVTLFLTSSLLYYYNYLLSTIKILVIKFHIRCVMSKKWRGCETLLFELLEKKRLGNTKNCFQFCFKVLYWGYQTCKPYFFGYHNVDIFNHVIYVLAIHWVTGRFHGKHVANICETLETTRRRCCSLCCGFRFFTSGAAENLARKSYISVICKMFYQNKNKIA